jgi:hypothetical protein
VERTELNANNKGSRMQTMACVTNGRLEDTKETITKNGKLLTGYKLHHPTADIDKLEAEK